MKQLKDYLHLYLGCPIRYHSKITGTMGIWCKLTCDDIQLAIDHIAFGEKLEIQLRPLSDMTEEEKTEYDAIYGDTVIDTIIARTYNLASPEKFRYLLSKHFDLFGLIDAGLAIDKTTLNPN